MTASTLPGWPWRLFATSLALACIGLGLFAKAPTGGGGASGIDSIPAWDLPDTISIRVLNGSGVPGLARRVQRFFQGSDELAVWAAPGPAEDADRDNYAETVIISHIPSTDAARAAASLLGLSDSCVVLELDADRSEDLTIVLGTDVAMGADSLIPYSDQ
jgi:hypothetical protein